MAAKVFCILLLLQSCILLASAIGGSQSSSAQKWYYISSTFETWFDALATCRSLHMKLLEIDSRQKNTQLQEYFKRRSYGTSTVNGFQILNYWTAGNNIDRVNLWTWRASDKNIGFTSWAPGQPDNNNYYGEEYCVELLYFTNTDLLWNDSNCLIKKQFVCES